MFLIKFRRKAEFYKIKEQANISRLPSPCMLPFKFISKLKHFNILKTGGVRAAEDMYSVCFWRPILSHVELFV
jgi:hypothetical protein